MVLTRENGVDSEGLVQRDGHAHCPHIVLLVQVVGELLLPSNTGRGTLLAMTTAFSDEYIHTTPHMNNTVLNN